MNLLQHPTSFLEQVRIGTFHVSYHNLMEVCQGGPVVGDLSINGKIINGLKFGGPLLSNGEAIIAPLFERRFWKTGFVIVSINLESMLMTRLSKILPLAYLNRIDGSNVYYFEDTEKIKESYIKIEPRANQ